MSRNNPAQIASTMLSWHSLDLITCEPLQTLWAGYGQICSITATARTAAAATHLNKLCNIPPSSNGTNNTYALILKLISPPNSNSTDEGHIRKMLSYEIEQYFYTNIVPHLCDIGVAKCLASTRDMHGKPGAEQLSGLMATIMVDLRPQYPVAGEKRGVLDSVQVFGALDWLASFHSRTRGLVPDDREGLVLPPLEEMEKRKKEGGKNGCNGLWLNGGYTYLATRRKEYASLLDDTGSEWCEALCIDSDGTGMSIAEIVAFLLMPCGRKMESYIHGDVKSENLFTSAKGDEVAFFDFQYVGLGLGVCDLAKLFTCSVPVSMLVGGDGDLPEKLGMCDGERDLLEWYHSRLVENEEAGFYEWEEFKRHWETALVDWCRFQASWGFWGNTEWLEARVRSILGDRDWKDWLYRERVRRPI
ncbi:phosphotransferase enzyme family protein [Penicillium bovifimosum]|uniref:Phosphotransferase enzyme family protein n=1 Tax=Penicillium bovifimosum TaxID=126998 RepID=A0A9W9GSH1_9EURO|nr:phosphotransferase enzyme family protein [Penicillium bovifimosum]KAJ5129269.1 phosphotransferase enzyme family protein [Penicillium bovifimosum]